MTDNEWLYKYYRCEGGGCLSVVVIIVLLSLLVSCRTQYVTVPEYHKEYVNRTDTFMRVDSFISNTNTIIREANDGDSLLLLQYGIRLKDNERLLLMLHNEIQRLTSEQQESRVDTFIKTDSVAVPYPVPAQLTMWQRAKVNLGGWAMGFLALLFILLVLQFYKRNFPP